MAKKESEEMKALRLERDEFMCALYDVINKRVAWSPKWSDEKEKGVAYRVGVTVKRDAWPLVLMQYFRKGQPIYTRVVPLDKFKDEQRWYGTTGQDADVAWKVLDMLAEIERKGKS